jgi:hypothetical protein
MRAVWKAHLNSRAALERAGAVDNGFYRKQCEGIDRIIGLLEKLPHSTVSEARPEPAKREAQDATQAERIAQITKQLSRAGKLPGELLDAHFAGEQTGDGQLGPSDFAAFYTLAVVPADLPAWRAALSKSKTWNRFADDGDIKGPVLPAGEALTVEPGLYRRDLGGVRIGDMVVVTRHGCGNLNRLSDGLGWQ